MQMELCASRSHQGLQLNYYLLTEPVRNLYGIAAEMKRPDGGGEREESVWFTDNREKALSLLKTLARGTVTPCVLLSVLDELLSD